MTNDPNLRVSLAVYTTNRDSLLAGGPRRGFLMILALLAVMLSAGPTIAQDVYQGNNNLPPWGGFSGGGIDTISLQNGNVHLHIPLGSWKQRGGSVVQLYFWYDTPTFVRQTIVQTVNGHRYYMTNVTGPTLYGGVSSNVGYWEASSPIGTVYCPGLQTNVNIFNQWVLSDPEGTKHPLDLQVTTMGCGGTNYTESPTMDGSGMMVNIGSNPPLLTLKDGTQIVLSEDSPYVYGSSATQEDTNGNLVALNDDTLQRNLVTTTQGSGYTLYSIKDPNGATQTYRVDYTSVPITTDFCTPSEKVPPYFTCNEVQGFSKPFPSKLTLPDQTAYQFLWVSDTPGELQEIVLPTGGSISYTWGNGGCTTGPLLGNNFPPYDCRAVVNGRTVTVNAVASTWAYGQDNLGNPRVTDPDGNDQIHVFAYPSVNGVVSPGSVETQVTYYQGPYTAGNILKQVAKYYTGEPNWLYQDQQLTNVREIQEVTTINGVVTQNETDYETFTSASNSQVATRLNPTEVREYAYGSGAPGALVRRTDYTYLHNVNPTYAALNIVDRPASVIIYDGFGNVASQTTYEYDVYNHTGLPSMGSSGAVQHDSARGTTYLTRGNQTGVSRWLNTNSSWLTSNNQFDDAGNLTAARDPNLNITSFSYTDAWASSSCAPAGQGKAYPTTVTNALGQLSRTTYNSCTGSVASSKDQNDINANGSGTTHSYDMFGRITAVNFPDGGQTTSCYTDLGGSTCSQSGPPFSTITTKAVTSATALTTTTLYDGLAGASQMQLDSDPEGVTYTDTTYDLVGQIYSISSPYRTKTDSTYGVTTYTHDALGRTCVVAPPDGTVFPAGSACPATRPARDTYTVYSGNTTTVTDQVGNSRKSVTDALGRVTGIWESPAGPSYETDYTYNALDDLLSVNRREAARIQRTGARGHLRMTRCRDLCVPPIPKFKQ